MNIGIITEREKLSILFEISKSPEPHHLSGEENEISQQLTGRKRSKMLADFDFELPFWPKNVMAFMAEGLIHFGLSRKIRPGKLL